MSTCPNCQRSYQDPNVYHCPFDGSPLPPDEKPEPILDGRYRLLKPLGKGTVGAVYRAEHLWMNKTVAIKLLRTEVTSSEEAVKRFAREARLASLMENPHCVSVYDFARASNGEYYLAMEFLEGESLFALLRRKKRLSTLEIRNIFGQILAALEAAHRIGIVHRDIKPENIMLLQREDTSHFIKILDFGIAKNLEGVDGDMGMVTRAGFTVGTPEYIAPEQATAAKVDGRADLYATGVMLFESLTGKRPFERESPVAVATAHVHDPPPKPSEVYPEGNISYAVEAVILQALEKEPEKRFASAKHFTDALYQAIPLAKKTDPETRSMQKRPFRTFFTPLLKKSYWRSLQNGVWQSPEHLGRLFGLAWILAVAMAVVLAFVSYVLKIP